MSETTSVSTATSGPTAGHSLRSSVFRSPFVGINDYLNSLTTHEKGLKYGFYNSIALIFALLVGCVLYFCHQILLPFLQPLLWALLCGSALHPFKRKLLLFSDNWIKDLKRENRPISMGAVCLPFSGINSIVDLIINFMLKYKKIFFCIPLYVVLNHSKNYLLISYEFIYKLVIKLMIVSLNPLSYLMNGENSYIIITLTIGYLIALSFGWSESTHKCLTFVTPFVWITLFILLIALSGTLGQILFAILVSIALIGLTKTLFKSDSHSHETNDQIDGLISFSLKLKNVFYSMTNSLMVWLRHEDNEPNDELSEESNEIIVTPEKERQREFASAATSPMPLPHIRDESISRRNSSNPTNSETNFGNICLYAVLWAIVFVQLWSHRNLIYLAPIPILFKLITIGFKYISSLILNNIHHLNGFIEKRKNAIFHPFLQNIYRYYLIGDKVIMETMESSLNGLTSLSIILFTLIAIAFIGIFMSIQIYGESLHLVNLMSNVLNKTMSLYPESTQLLPESFKGVDGMLDEMVKNGYEYGREYIKNSIRDILNVDGNVTKTQAVEKQVLEIWDRAYHLWLIRNSNETDGLPERAPYEFKRLSNAFATLDLKLVFNIAKENIDILLSVLDSVWLLLKGNVSLLLTAMTAVFSIILGGGLGLINSVISFIIFMTALFYLLSTSDEYYKPVELINRIIPSEVTAQQSVGSSKVNTNRMFGRAVEEAINGVFEASLKMSAFYGLYTWLIHTVFDVKIVYIPSVLAAMLGAVPFLSAFWASFPAFLELFFVQNQTSKAILFLISAYFPSLIVDANILSEIKSAGHPYLTGLSIAGGVFYLGFEGAIIGPILLCCLFVVFNIYTNIMQESPSQANPMASDPPLTPHSAVRNTPVFKRMQSLK